MAPITIERAVIEGINRGNSDSLAELYDRYFSYLCACATVYTLDPDASQQIVNDVFINVWNRRGTLEYPIHAYLVRSVHNGCLNHLRSCRLQRSLMERYRAEMLEWQEEFCLSEPTPLQNLEAREWEELVRTSVESLPPKCREVFERYFYQHLSPAEIAVAMGISVNTVRVQVKIAMDRIRTLLGPLAAVSFFLFLLNNTQSS